jgi:WD40 repeat protein
MARVYSISTGERVHAWQPHEDYIRSITVHPTLPIILTASDDCTIKSWDWEKAWRCTQEYTGHNHYIMSLSIVCLLTIVVLAAGSVLRLDPTLMSLFSPFAEP